MPKNNLCGNVPFEAAGASTSTDRLPMVTQQLKNLNFQNQDHDRHHHQHETEVVLRKKNFLRPKDEKTLLVGDGLNEGAAASATNTCSSLSKDLEQLSFVTETRKNERQEKRGAMACAPQHHHRSELTQETNENYRQFYEALNYLLEQADQPRILFSELDKI